MPNVTVERRSAPRHAMVLAREVVELPRGTKLNARTADLSQTGRYIDTLNPIPPVLRSAFGSSTMKKALWRWPASSMSATVWGWASPSPK